MTSASRFRMPRPERVAPIRSGTLSLFGTPARAPTDQAVASEPATPTEAIRRTIEHAYSIVDDHIKQGESAARRMARREYGASAFAHDVQDAAARSAQFLTEVFEVWLQTGTALASPPPAAGGPPAPEATFRPPAPTPSAAAPARSVSAARVAVSVESSRPTEVRVECEPTRGRVSVQPLLGRDSTIRTVTVERVDPIHLRIVVPPDQAPGHYSGLLVDSADNRPVGSVWLRVGDAGGGDVPEPAA